MKKFLAVFDGYKMCDSTLQYAIQLSKAVNAHLVGVFLDEFIYRSYNVAAVMESGNDYEKVMAKLDEEDHHKRDEAVRVFQMACSKAGIHCSIHRDKNIALQELKEESMFADLIFINEYETFTRHKEEPPTRFIKELLGDVQCPVLVTPNDFKIIDKIVLLYDGAPSSLYAIKMYNYLFCALPHMPVEVFTVKNDLEDLHLPGNRKMREFIKRQFPDAVFTVTKGDPEEQILGHLRNHEQNELVVLGAYRRTEMSRWFKMSMADVLMRELDMPIFVAHNK
ncbi:universal stress protein [Segetibacter sp. 3557_3]|uniref:universal stress protein n=1 Tax=Segetibacter sp. 3557_3 TaxID=2547429 RepID=UPI0010584260|nr:universal stress protein [Segetibacter sp. 3557_3]TDH29243.1 universal stress protein [Segetibacter sp. 3557_3]